MKDWWMKLGCFLTGYNYTIVRSSSEASAKAVKKYLAALVIVSIIWTAIGFAFTQRYLKANFFEAAIGGLIMLIIIIQVERQIILSVTKNWLTITFRIAIGLVMAVIGSVIIDQIIFKEDIERGKISKTQEIVNEVMIKKTSELNGIIHQIDTVIFLKEAERTRTGAEVTSRPTIPMPNYETKFEKDSTGKMVPVQKTISSQAIPNPKIALLPQLDNQLTILRKQKSDREDELMNIRENLETQYMEKTGFLEELSVLQSLLADHGSARAVWIMFFLFFLFIELFVLVSKFGDNKNDYDQVILHQLNTRIRMLEELVDKKSN